VEELANLADDGVRRLGMGGIDLKNKAKAWLAAASDKGKLTHEMAALQKKADFQESTIATLQAKLEELTNAMAVHSAINTVNIDQHTHKITASDLIEEEAPKPRKR
jgi:hypothetical protein